MWDPSEYSTIVTSVCDVIPPGNLSDSVNSRKKKYFFDECRTIGELNEHMEVVSLLTDLLDANRSDNPRSEKNSLGPIKINSSQWLQSKGDKE
ncbi:hypothetical protein DASC09_017330 [Saccharomycopsis crataegensis]|uniref:Uncharacterized protein n=1 Tax=Saccharomycopsis crataegensis TaxID=43959 RepID=A0AAV5QJT8_9ASCO|nr:hypothetical protein DASC09_017330 [Saccharomycopsis crataegensis]